MSSKVFPLNSTNNNKYIKDELNNNKVKYLTFMFDSTVGNFPAGAAIALIITITGTIMISSGIGTCSVVLSEYHSSLNHFSNYLFTFLGLLNLLHSFVFLHGVSVGCLETSRERFHSKEIGCYCGKCKDRHSACGRVCRKIQHCNRVSCQVFWGICGTIMIFCYYPFALGFFTVSTLSTFFSYVLTQTCHSYETLIEKNMDQTKAYLNQAKEYIGKAGNATQHILYQYSRLVALQDMVAQGNPMEQMSRIETPKYFETPHKKEDWGRQLIETYDPMASLTKGQTVLATLNETIYHTEQRLDRYEVYFQETVQFCTDYANLYDNLYMVSIGSLLLLISHYIIFAVHYKYFTVWNYEARLLNNEDYN